MTDPGPFQCSFHGTGIEVSGSAAVLSALASRLGQLPETGLSGPPLRFEYSAATSLSEHAVKKPTGQGRPFYEPLAGEAIYFPADDTLYLDYGGRVRALCRPAEGICQISLLQPEAEQLWLGTHPLFTIPLIEMLKRRGRFNVHAAGLALHGCAVLLPGTTGAGKSTLTITLLSAGFDLIGDDMAFLEPAATGELRVLALPEKLDVTAATAAFFPELQALARQPRRIGWPKHEVQAQDYFAALPAWTTTPKALVFPRISPSNETVLTPISSDEAFLELAPNVLLTEPAATRAHFAALGQLAKTTPCYRMHTGRDFGRIPGLIEDLLR